MITVYDFVVHAHDLPNMSMFKHAIEELGLEYKISKWTTVVPTFFTQNPQFKTIQEDDVMYFKRGCHYALQVIHDNESKDILDSKMWSTLDMLKNKYDCTGILLEKVTHRK